MSGEIRELTVRLDVRRGDTSGIDNVNKSLNQTIKNSNKAEKSANAVARAYKTIAIGLPAGIGLGMLANKAIDYHDALIDVKKKVDDFGNGGVAGFETFVSELRKQVNMSRVDILKLGEVIGASGKQGEELKNMMETVAKAASAFQMSVEDTWGTMNSVSSEFGMAASEYKEFADATAYLDNKTGANAKNTLASMQRFGGMAKEFGLTWRQALGMSSAMLETVGPENVEQAATAWRELLQTFGAASISSKNFQKGFSMLDLGMGTKEFDAARVKDPINALGMLMEKINGLKEVDRLPVIKLLFGGGLSTSAIAAISRDWGHVARNIGFANDKLAQTGYLESQAGQEMTKWKARTALIVDKFSTLFDALNVRVIPAALDFLDVLTKIVEQINKINPKTLDMILYAGGGLVLGYKLGGVKGAMIGLIAGVGKVAYNQLRGDYDAKPEANIQSSGSGYGLQSYATEAKNYTPISSNNSNKSVNITNHYSNTFEGSKSGYGDFFNALDNNNRKQSIIANSY